MHGWSKSCRLDVDNDDGEESVMVDEFHICHVVVKLRSCGRRSSRRLEKSTSTHFSIRRLLLHLIEARRSRKCALVRSPDRSGTGMLHLVAAATLLVPDLQKFHHQTLVHTNCSNKMIASCHERANQLATLRTGLQDLAREDERAS
jgi:hypothetical protein